MLLQQGASEQSAVEGVEIIESDPIPGRDSADCGGHRIDVRQHLTGSEV
jgi:hypothetical protein